MSERATSAAAFRELRSRMARAIVSWWAIFPGRGQHTRCAFVASPAHLTRATIGFAEPLPLEMGPPGLEPSVRRVVVESRF